MMPSMMKYSGFLGDKSTAKWLYNSVTEWGTLQGGYVVHNLVMNFKTDSFKPDLCYSFNLGNCDA